LISVTSAIHGLLLWSEYAILYHVSNLIATQSELLVTNDIFCSSTQDQNKLCLFNV